ncbi:preprotein translocase subunit YajC [Nocardioides cavernaquae]|nr:preprotein translocase subunit YajC [Nocardioides cavernaquae]
MTDLYALLPMLGIFAVLWLLLVLPARRRQRAMAELQAGIAVGDTLVTSGGIYGTVTRLDDDRIGLEIAPGVIVELARGAIVGAPQPGAHPASAHPADQPVVDKSAEGDN